MILFFLVTVIHLELLLDLLDYFHGARLFYPASMCFLFFLFHFGGLKINSLLLLDAMACGVGFFCWGYDSGVIY